MDVVAWCSEWMGWSQGGLGYRAPCDKTVKSKDMDNGCAPTCGFQESAIGFVLEHFP